MHWHQDGNNCFHEQEAPFSQLEQSQVSHAPKVYKP